ncbi:endo alpha-1,4 polygalactosaminidase [Pseudonocardia nantongensis]|uniref:endo alpha-1,4 polygalactosaminidase n=1 Tax=Pseudonocardia nantongensis TaxID=1181885 RepID=UPI003979CB5D
MAAWSLLAALLCVSSVACADELWPGVIWAPEPGVGWQYQLQGEIDTSVPADVYVVDLFDVDKSVVADVQTNDRHVVCYLNAGALEEWRPDAGDYPPELVGEPLRRWPGESWVDVRRTDLLEPIIAARIDLCSAKGFDAVDPDNLDGYLQDTGFPITADDQLRFNRMIARLAHDRGLGVGLKNDVEQIPELVDSFDFAVNERCFAEAECSTLQPFVDAGKAVLHIEYESPTSVFCPTTTALGFSSIRKSWDLGADREACPAA